MFSTYYDTIVSNIENIENQIITIFFQGVRCRCDLWITQRL